MVSKLRCKATENSTGIVLVGCLVICLASESLLAQTDSQSTITAEQSVFFESKIRPVLVQHCYQCHGADQAKLKGGLRLDQRMGWQAGGDSEQPAIIPGDPDNSPLIRAIRHAVDVEPMPPDSPKLSTSVIADFVSWVRMGAPDPRAEVIDLRRESDNWQATYEKRLDWWSLKPVQQPSLPLVANNRWCSNDVDTFVLAKLESVGLQPSQAADRSTLARRLSFALTGLPPTTDLMRDCLQDRSPQAFDHFIEKLLADPHFGERWARHWMDVVHYSDTHGYEWDAPAKNAYLYRDYVARALNSDLSIQRFFMEQIAGDLMDQRVDRELGLNETLIAPMAFRLGERRHGDNIDAEGISQEAMANIVDTLGKGFLGTTVACAQCHDHKLDAVPQRDYYALTGIFMSTRWPSRCVEIYDRNIEVIAELRRIKREIQKELAGLWKDARQSILNQLRAMAVDEKLPASFPETFVGLYQRSRKSPISKEQFLAERNRRKSENAANLKLIADFVTGHGASGDDKTGHGMWQWEGAGMKHGLVRDGEIVVADEGDLAISHVLPAGRWTHAWSARMAGALRSPLFSSTTPVTFSIECAGGQHPGFSFIVDAAIHSERLQFLNRPQLGWLTQTSGNFRSLEGSVDERPRRLYFEMVTKALNNYFPPRTAYGGLSEANVADPRSWFGVTRIYEHPPGKPPLDELDRFTALFDREGDWETRIADELMNAVDYWSCNKANSETVKLINEALQHKLLANDQHTSADLERLINEYRETEKRIQADLVVGSMADWNEGRNEKISLRGSYTDLGEEVQRGCMSAFERIEAGQIDRASGRLELARTIASENNPLTARVFVNRVWQQLFGQGIVRTPDDFGHLGEEPSHPELLDYLATRFVHEQWSLKKLIRILVASSTWRQQSVEDSRGRQVDPENRLLHHFPIRRMEAEAIRDSILAVSGRLDQAIGGPAVDPYRTAQDAAKRLFSGPLDGNGRRSIYTKLTLMEPPRFLALFNQPIPKLTTGRRDVTSVPDQALALLNDPFVLAMAKQWADVVIHDGSATSDARIQAMLFKAISRLPREDEVSRLDKLAHLSAQTRKLSVMDSPAVWQDVAHAIFNMKEFIHVR
jgi:mono/diheme cytochrome c family protein